MLEIRNLTKIYKPKKGVPVTALNHVSLRFPEKGMVFLLGKSGSGKSTLLNLLGGLDRYDTGEILIKGVSSASFKQKHFDSYRNTYVGFIFQEYNILEQFSVGANVALALELQGKKATDEEINRILTDVDLAGFGARKPNELSGGQKQRVAIARALVKNPQIIMADEPTGALDSATGRQVLDTLKKLSATKLVLVVSHDREFAEAYADRVIELADGSVIRDDEYADAAPMTGLIYEGETITVPPQYHLTEEDREQINAYLDTLASGGKLALSSRSGRKAVATDESRIPAQKSNDFKLIRSRLPMKFAFRMGASGLKYKKIRLVFTILLSCVAFTLFGLADAFGAYRYVNTCTDSLIDSNIDYATLVKESKITDGEEAWYTSYGHYISRDDLASLREKTGLIFNGVYTPPLLSLRVEEYFGTVDVEGDDLTPLYLWARQFNGFADISDEGLEAMGAKLVAGRLPDGSKDEILISSYFAQGFAELGYIDRDNGSETAEKITSVKDMVGKTLLGYTVVGIADTGVDIARYRAAYDGTYNYDNLSDIILSAALDSEFSNLKQYSLACTALTGKGFVDRLSASMPTAYSVRNMLSMEDNGGNYYASFGNILDASTLNPAQILWKEGVSSLGENEVLLTLMDAKYMFDYRDGELPDSAALLEKLSETDFSLCVMNDDYNRFSAGTVKVVGLVDLDASWCLIAGKELATAYGEIPDGIFSQAVAPMPTSRADIRSLVAMGTDEKSDIRFAMQNPVCFELSAIGDILKTLSPVFMWAGVFFAVFAMLLLANFISVSITNKKREIGILRAIGSRGNDVFRIFFSESFIIAFIEFVLASAAVVAVCFAVNNALRGSLGILVTAVSFGWRQVVLELLLALLTAAIASFLPVKHIASKKPIDAIRSL